MILLLTHQTIDEATRAAMPLFLRFVYFCDTLTQRTPPELFHLINSFRERKLVILFQALLRETYGLKVLFPYIRKAPLAIFIETRTFKLFNLSGHDDAFTIFYHARLAIRVHTRI